MSKLKVACDVDEVINNMIDKAIELYNNRYGAELTKDMFVEYDIYKCLPFEEAEAFIDLFLQEELWDSVEPVNDAQWGLKYLVNNGFEVYLATATHYGNFQRKVDWIEKYFPFIDKKNIICIHNKSLLDVDFIIDDCAENLINCKWPHRILVDRPWNQQPRYGAYHLYRTYDWHETIDIITTIAKEE